MDAEKKRPFPHRLNPDGSYDSICPRCFLTIVKGADEQELKAGEERHTCEGRGLNRKNRPADECDS